MWCLERRMNDKLSLTCSGTERQEGGGGKGVCRKGVMSVMDKRAREPLWPSGKALGW